MKGLSLTDIEAKAWHEGRLTVIRRVMKPQPDLIVGDMLRSNTWYAANKGDFAGDPDREIKPQYQPGETVYIKEVWSVEWPCIRYKAGRASREIFPGEPHFNDMTRLYDNQCGLFRSPVTMPEWASRSHALIVSVRPERIREITTGECVKEGFKPKDDRTFVSGIIDSDCGDDEIKERFADLWDSLHPGSWDQNDFIWRIELENK